MFSLVEIVHSTDHRFVADKYGWIHVKLISSASSSSIIEESENRSHCPNVKLGIYNLWLKSYDENVWEQRMIINASCSILNK